MGMTDETYQDFAARVYVGVQASDLSIAELARRIGKRRSYVANVLQGRFMSRPVLHAIQSELGKP